MMTGVSVGQLLTGTIPQPSLRLRFGQDIPPDVMEAMRNGGVVEIIDGEGHRMATLLMDYYGTIREKRAGGA